MCYAMVPESATLQLEHQPTIDLLSLLSNTLILDHVTPYIDASSMCQLGETSRDFRSLVKREGMRYLDLTYKKSLVIRTGPIDSGGHNWNAERLDEAFTEDEFYGGPIRGVFNILQRKQWLYTVSTLVLDGLTVTVDVIREILLDDRFNVKILSVRDCLQLNQRNLCGLLKYATRPTRPAGTPKLRGLYVFGPKESNGREEESPLAGRRRSPTRYPESRPSHAVNAVAIQLGPDWANRTKAALVAEHHEDDEDKWYHSAGKLITRHLVSEWAETVQACESIIHFDAVLCRGPRHQVPGPGQTATAWLPPAIATIALGPDGCQKCKSSPEGPGIFGVSPSHELPLLAPPPFTSPSLRSAQKPSSSVGYEIPKMIARCKECLKSRWCERCHKWWCEPCYTPGQPQQHEHAQNAPNNDNENSTDLDLPMQEDIKVHMGLCIPCFVNDMVMENQPGPY
jgi:hypothetical protein